MCFRCTFTLRATLSLIRRKRGEGRTCPRGSFRSYNSIMETKKELSPEQREELLRALKARFEKNMNRHKGLEWAKVQAKLEAKTEKLQLCYSERLI